MKKVLVTDYVHPYLIEGLKELGYDVEYDQNFDVNGLDEAIINLSGIVINSKIKLNRTNLPLAKNLQFIARLGSGLEIVDLNQAEKQGIKVFNSPEGNRNAVAEHAMGMLLALNNNLLRADSEIRNLEWNREKNRGLEIEGKTFGIIGLGNTGMALANKLSGWTQKVLYYDKYRLDKPKQLTYIEEVSLEVLKESSDIISLHLPLTNETKNLVDEVFLKECKRKPILINTSRGGIVNTQDLIIALEHGIISGACLDVFENEKPFSFTSEENQLYTRLYNMDNVILSPHVAGWTHESLFKIAQHLIAKIKMANFS